MTTTTYTADRTALLIVDPYNDLPLLYRRRGYRLEILSKVAASVLI
jgi:hypothetical protein